MGFNGGNEIFDPVVKELLDCKTIPSNIKTRITAKLIDVLQDADWDTQDESYEIFKGQPEVVAAFRQECPWIFEEEDDG